MNKRNNFPSVPLHEVPSPGSNSKNETYRPVVMVVDDESSITDTLAEILSRSGYTAITAYDGDSALESALLMPPEMLITDVVLPGMSGIELAITVKRIFPDCKIILFSGTSLNGRPAHQSQSRWASVSAAQQTDPSGRSARAHRRWLETSKAATHRNGLTGCEKLISSRVLCQGTTSVVPHIAEKMRALAPEGIRLVVDAQNRRFPRPVNPCDRGIHSLDRI